jgi:hypothetical protein
LASDRASPEELTILRFRHFLETRHLVEQILKTAAYMLKLCTQTIIDCTLVAASGLQHQVL